MDEDLTNMNPMERLVVVAVGMVLSEWEGAITDDDPIVGYTREVVSGYPIGDACRTALADCLRRMEESAARATPKPSTEAPGTGS